MTDIETADALHLAGDIDAAAHVYRRVLAADQGNVAAWHGLGAARLRVGAYGEASEALLHAVRQRPEEVGAWGLLAEALFNLGDVERAIYA
jgi:protein O-GlcNAc transferase